MEITIKGEAKEIAALVVELQERRGSQYHLELNGKSIAQAAFAATRDMPAD